VRLFILIHNVSCSL